LEPGIIVLFVVLAGVWGAFLFPEVFASRKEAPLNTTEEFGRWTSKLASVQGRTARRRNRAVLEVHRNRVLARRRIMLVVLLLAAVGTLVAALMTGSTTLLYIHIAVDAAVACYVAMLVQIKQRRRMELAQLGETEVAQDESSTRIRVVASR
jgi:hypothetical protein